MPNQPINNCLLVNTGGIPSLYRPVVGVTTIRRAELTPSKTSMTASNDLAICRTLEMAGVEFIDENGKQMLQT